MVMLATVAFDIVRTTILGSGGINTRRRSCNVRHIRNRTTSIRGGVALF